MPVDEKVYVAGDAHAGQRLDQFLAQQMTELSRARIQELIAGGSVSIGDSAPKPSYRMRAGEQVHVASAEPRPAIKSEPEEIDIEVVLDDPDFAVVNKPAGMTVHAGAGDLERNRGTLVNAMLHRFQKLSAGGDELRPGIVHRLDRETSGLVIIAKTDLAHARLAAQFQKREVQKRYVALVHGTLNPASGTVKYAIDRDPIHRKKMRALRDAARPGGRAAVSHYETVENIAGPYGAFTLAHVRIETGRTHQIRVHMAALRHAVVGDRLYGGASVLTRLRGDGAPVEVHRNFLHAEELMFAHPRSGETVRCFAPLPEELCAILRRVRGESV